jgi:hypothetical protein
MQGPTQDEEYETQTILRGNGAQRTPLTLVAHPNQTADLLSIRDYDGAPIFSIGPGGASGSSGADYSIRAGVASSSVALQTAITTLGTTGGDILLGRGTHTWTTTPTIPPGITGRLRIMGAPGAKILLSSGAPRFLDFGKTADYDTFQNIEIRDLLIDANSIGGRHHVVIGTYIAGTPQTRISVNQLTIENVKTINVPVDSTLTNHRLNVWIVPGTPTGTTAISIKNVRVNNVRFEGGNQGIVVGAADAAAGANCTVDEIHITNWWHSRTTVHGGPAAFSSSNVQVGSRATVGRVRIANGYGEFSGDVGIEVDNAQDLVCENVKIVDAFNIAFLLANFVAPTSTMAQKLVFDKCVGVRATSTAGVGFRIDNQGNAFGNITIAHCKWHHTQGGYAISGGDGVLLTQSPDLHSLLVDDFDYVREGFAYTGATNANVDCFAIGTISTSRSPHVTLRDVRIRVVGSRDNATAGALQICGIAMAGSTYSFTIENPYFHFDITSMSTNGISCIQLGRESAALRGTIRGIRLGTISDDTGPRGVIIRGTGTLTISNEVLIDDCDFVRMPSGVSEFLFTTPINRSKVRLKNIQYRIRPHLPAALGTLNFDQGSWTTATANQYIGGHDAEVHFLAATGAGITKIEASKDGTTYEEMWTQSSGVMSQDVMVPVENGDYMKVTFATTQPTTKVRFRR